MKKFIVSWKPTKTGRVQFVSGPVEAEDEAAAVAAVAEARSYPLAFVVEVREYVRDLWTPVAAGLVEHLHNKAIADGTRSLGD